VITRIKIDGFKSFVDFELDVSPLLVLVGPNGSGKSNLFDALTLVSDSVLHGFSEAIASHPRGHGANLFHQGPEGTWDAFRITVGAVIASPYGPLPVQVRLDVKTRDGDIVAQGDSAAWVSSLSDRDWLRRLGVPAPFEAAMDAARRAFHDSGETAYVGVGADGPSPGGLWSFLAAECASWSPLTLSPAAMRSPVPQGAAERIRLRRDGDNLAAVLHRLEAAGSLRDLEVDFAAVIPGGDSIKPLFDERRREYDFDVLFRETGSMIPPLLSEGTLRVLALLADSYDPLGGGVLAVEELENGFHPAMLAELVRRLRRGVSDFSVPESGPVPLRQLLFTTHSPVLLSVMQDERDGTVVFLEPWKRIEPGRRGATTVTRARPVVRNNVSGPDSGETATDYEVREVLETVRGVAQWPGL
jgi:predicted ATPase